MSTLPKTYYSPEEYLELERKAEYKSEFYNGEIFAMSGASRKHDLIAAQALLLVGQHLRGKRCRWHTSDMRVLVQPHGLYTYPDLSATFEEPMYADASVDTLVNPTLIIEILSPSTEGYDRGRKARMYREMPSLLELLLVDQDRFEVELHRKQDNGTWVILNAVGLESAIELKSIGYTLRLAELYENVVEPNA